MEIMVEVPAIQCGVSLVNRSLLAVGVGTQKGGGANAPIFKSRKQIPTLKKSRVLP